MPNKRRENLLFGDWVDLVNSDSCNLLSKLSFRSPFVHSLDNHDLWLQYAFEWIFKDHTISQLPLLTASSTSSSIIAAATPILFKCSTWSFSDGNQRSYHNNRKCRASDISRKKSKISRDFQGQIRRKIGRFRGILAEKVKFQRIFRGKFIEKSANFTGNFKGKLCQETISKKQPILLVFFGQISLKTINFASIWPALFNVFF